jgi:hypothetical protein
MESPQLSRLGHYFIRTTDRDWVYDSGGTVDFQGFIGGSSACNSRGGTEEKLRCTFPPGNTVEGPEITDRRTCRVQGL